MRVNKAKTDQKNILESQEPWEWVSSLTGTHIGPSPLPSLLASLIQATCWRARHEPDGEFREVERELPGAGRRHCSPSPHPHPACWSMAAMRSSDQRPPMWAAAEPEPPTTLHRNKAAAALHLPNLPRVSLIARLNTEPRKERNSENSRRRVLGNVAST